MGDLIYTFIRVRFTKGFLCVSNSGGNIRKHGCSWYFQGSVRQEKYTRLLLVCDHYRTPIDQSHRYGRHQPACREPAGSYDKTTRTVICFEHKTQYLLVRAPYTRIVVFWHIGMFFWNIAIQPAVGCYNSWANVRCSGCYPLVEKLLWNRSSVMAKHGGPCVHFSGISTCGRTSRETVSHPQHAPLPILCKISLPVHVIVTNGRL